MDIPRVTTSSGPGTNQKSLQGAAVRTTVVFTYTVGGRAPRAWSAALAGRPRAFEARGEQAGRPCGKSPGCSGLCSPAADAGMAGPDTGLRPELLFLSSCASRDGDVVAL